MDENTKLIPIAYDYLYDGMTVQDDIYNYNGKIVLLPKGVVLDELKLSRLKRFNSDRRNIKVKINTYNTLRENKAVSQALQLEKLENDTGYGTVKDSVNSFLTQTKYGANIDVKQTNNLTQNITEVLNSSQVEKIFECVNAPHPADAYLQHHSLNVSILNGIMGKWLNLSTQEVQDLILTGLLHDIGKTKVDQEILNAPRKLTAEEYEHIKQHASFSYDLLRDNDLIPERVKLGALYHHERENGQGYPNKLQGDAVPLFAKITAVSDVYDALASRRCYKQEQSALNVLGMMWRGEVGLSNNLYLKVFCQHMPQNFLNKSALMNDGTIAMVRFISITDVEHPVLDIDGEIKQATDEWTCSRILIEE